MNPTSSAQGATLLSATDPAQSMTEHETSLTAGKGGIGPSAGVTDEARASVKANTALFTNLSLASVPFTSCAMPAPARPSPVVDRWKPAHWPN